MASVPLAAHANPTAAPSAGASFTEASEKREATNIVTILPGISIYAQNFEGGEMNFAILPPNNTYGFFVPGILKPILDGSPVEQWGRFTVDLGDGEMREYYIDFISRNQDFIDDNLRVTV